MNMYSKTRLSVGYWKRKEKQASRNQTQVDDKRQQPKTKGVRCAAEEVCC
jgi:hypothetical protein